jgi:hypothetical protein
MGEHRLQASIELIESNPVEAAEEMEHLRGALSEARLYGEKMRRDRDEAVRRCGDDLVALIDAERGQ